MRSKASRKTVLHAAMAIVTSLIVGACSSVEEIADPPEHFGPWALYHFDIGSGEFELLYSGEEVLSTLRLSHDGGRLAFCRSMVSDDPAGDEIFSISTGGGELRRLTDNSWRDHYPCWSPGDSLIAFLSWREDDINLDIYRMRADGSDQVKLYDSGYHDADIDWRSGQIAFTRESRIWIMEESGSNETVVSDPPQAGEWGDANLPFGDYDPRFSPDGNHIIFERLIDDACPHGDYDLFTIELATGIETRITETGWTQGLAEWSPDASKLLMIVATVDCQGRYDLYRMDRDGGNLENLRPQSCQVNFLFRGAVFGEDENSIYLIGEWWE